MGLDRCTDSFKIGRDKSVNTLGFLMGWNLKMTQSNFLYLGSRGGGGASFETIQARYSSKASVGQAKD